MTRDEANFIANNSQYQKVLDRISRRAIGGSFSVTLKIDESIRDRLRYMGYSVVCVKGPDNTLWYEISWI